MGIPAQIEFNRDVRPLLADNCFACHGPDAANRQGKLRLDVREAALAKEAFFPGKPAESELVVRIHSQDKDEMMPPPDSHKKLSARDKAVLARWIAQGAEYQNHWAYERPVKAAIPARANAIDTLVARRLITVGMKPSPEADRRTLIRRLSSDLIGLPPTPAEVAAFMADATPDAYARLVDRLLADPRYGERMAVGWLDLVRFADTIGYHSDNPRNVWPYRDWVIQSFNTNKRFDRFTLEQIAGDLLPDASVETRVGSAFNRLLLSTEEGGAQPKDYEARMMADRVWHGMARADDRLRAVPRSQIRSLHVAGFLFARCLFRRCEGALGWPARGRDARDDAGANGPARGAESGRRRRAEKCRCAGDAH